ncbi:polygalacturonase-like protein, partial [Tanacetum coccineum]
MINSPMVVEGAVVPRRLINVVRLGAIPDGQTDASVPFQSAWASACSSFTPSTIYLPAGRFFVRSAYFQGDRCKNKAIKFVINETLLTPSDFRNLVWIKFEKVTGVPGEHNNCPHQMARVSISNMRYDNIHDTSATEIGVKLDCSKEHPCNDMQMEDVNLSYENRPAHESCVNAFGPTR